MEKQQGQKRAIFVLFLSAIVILLNHLYRWPLYDRGVDWIIAFQSRSFWLLDWFFLAVTMVIDPSIVFLGTIIMMIVSKKKAKAFIMLIFVLLNVYLAALLKAYDCDPRPIWTSDKIRNIGFYCPVEYGNPSGHSWFSAVIGFGALLNEFGAGKNFINIWISVGLCILVPFSRMYLGAHSLNQVLEGLTLGLACCLLYTFSLKSNIHSFLVNFSNSANWKILITCCHMLYVIPFILNAKEELPDSWIQNISEKCHKVINEEQLNYLMFVANALFVNVATGIAIGFPRLAATPAGLKYLRGEWEINQYQYEFKKGYFLFILIELGCLVSGLACAAIVIKFLPIKIVGFICLSLGGLLSGITYTCRTLPLLLRMKIIRTN